MITPPLPSLPQPGVSGSDKLLVILCHLSLFFGFAFILPLIVFLVRKEESVFVAAHAREALNFHISLVIYFICTIPLLFVLIGFPIMIALGIGAAVCAIIASIRASESRFYRYPLTIRLI